MKQGDAIIVDNDYRIRRTSDGLFIEVLDYHADPLLLDHETLKLLGFDDDGGVPDRPVRTRRPIDRPAKRA